MSVFGFTTLFLLCFPLWAPFLFLFIHLWSESQRKKACIEGFQEGLSRQEIIANIMGAQFGPQVGQLHRANKLYMQLKKKHAKK